MGMLTQINELPHIHTSDRRLYKRCRRKWWLSSQLGRSLVTSDEPYDIRLWFGTGYHFMLQDYHAYRVFDDPYDAWKAYVKATPTDSLPLGYGPDVDRLAAGMFHYYTNYWLPIHKEYQTLWINDVPQVEVNFALPIPDVDAVYMGTFDRVVMDPEGRIWIVEYKTAATVNTLKLETDAQVNAYDWAAREIYGSRYEGVLYMQFRKALAEYPRENKNGSFSTDKRQNTTAMLYRKALIDKYGEIPVEYHDVVEHFQMLEAGGNGDPFIRRDRVYRNEWTARSELRKIQAEAREMLDPNLAIYTNATEDCGWDCAFRDVCIAMDDGGDWEDMIALSFVPQTREKRESWRDRIQYPNNDRLRLMQAQQRSVVTSPLLTI